MCNGTVLRNIGGLAQLFPKLIASFKLVDQETPVFLHPKHSISGPAELDGVGFQQDFEKTLQRIDVRSSGKEHTGITDESSSYHDGIHLGIFFGKLLNLADRTEISVVANGISGVLHKIAEGLHMHISCVESFADSGVEGQFLDGITVEDFNKPREFCRVMDAQSSLDRNRQRSIPEDGVQETVQRVGVREHPSTLSLGGDGAGWTADVKVHFLITPILALLSGPEEVLGNLGQNLGHGFEGDAVGKGELPLFPVGQLVVYGGGNEGHIVAVHAAEVFMMQPPVDAVRQPLHGSIIVMHIWSAFLKEIIVYIGYNNTHHYEESQCDRRSELHIFV